MTHFRLNVLETSFHIRKEMVVVYLGWYYFQSIYHAGKMNVVVAGKANT